MPKDQLGNAYFAQANYGAWSSTVLRTKLEQYHVCPTRHHRCRSKCVRKKNRFDGRIINEFSTASFVNMGFFEVTDSNCP